jgi:hypothetical protein
MSETGSIDMGMPGEGGAGVSEALSEDAKQRFAAAQTAMKALQRDEKRSKKRDDRIAQTIIKFLKDEENAKFFVLISRLVARDCPSIFLVALLSLIDDDCQTVFAEFAKENELELPDHAHEKFPVLKISSLDVVAQDELLLWITRMQVVLSVKAKDVLQKLIVDEGNLDGTVLQLTTFVLQEFFRKKHGGNAPPFEQLHAVAAGILQSVFEPFMDLYELPKPSEDNDD